MKPPSEYPVAVRPGGLGVSPAAPAVVIRLSAKVLPDAAQPFL